MQKTFILARSFHQADEYRKEIGDDLVTQEEANYYCQHTAWPVNSNKGKK